MPASTLRAPFSVRSPLLGALVLALSGVISCGGGDTPPAKTAGSSPPSRARRPIVEDRSPVPRPKGLLAQLHSVGLGPSVRAVMPYLPPGVPKVDPRALAEVLTSMNASIDQVVDTAQMIDVDRPIDAAVLLEVPGGAREPQFAAAFAVGLLDGVDLDALLEARGTRVEIAPGGVRRLFPDPEKFGIARDHVEKSSRCVIAPAIGATTHRLICAYDGDPLVLAPWLARGVTREPDGSAFHVEVDVAAARNLFASELENYRAKAKAIAAPELKLGWPNLDRVAKKLGVALIDEIFDFAEDLDAYAFDLDLAKEGPRFTATSTFGSSKSWIARAALAGGESPRPAPQAFGRLPAKDALFAIFGRATPETNALIQPLQSAVADLIDAAAADFQWPAKDRAAALEVVKFSFPTAADVATVSGMDFQRLADEVKSKKDAIVKDDDAKRDAQSMLKDFLSPSSFGISVAEREAKVSIDALRALATFASRPSFAKTITTLAKGRVKFDLKVREVSPKGLPKGSFGQRWDFAVALPEHGAAGATPNAPAPKGGKKGEPPLPKFGPPTKFYSEFLVAAEGARTWTGYGQNLPEGDLSRRLQAALSGTGPTLSQQLGFELATQGTPASGGLVIFEGATQTLLATNEPAIKEFVEALPDRGRGAFAWQGGATKPPRKTAESVIFVPRDLVAVVARLWVMIDKGGRSP